MRTRQSNVSLFPYGLLEEREIKLNPLRRALIEGEESGFVEYSLDGRFKDLDKERISYRDDFKCVWGSAVRRDR